MKTSAPDALFFTPDQPRNVESGTRLILSLLAVYIIFALPFRPGCHTKDRFPVTHWMPGRAISGSANDDQPTLPQVAHDGNLAVYSKLQSHVTEQETRRTCGRV